MENPEEINIELEVVEPVTETDESSDIGEALVGVALLAGVGALSFYTGLRYTRVRDRITDGLAVRRKRRETNSNEESSEENTNEDN